MLRKLIDAKDQFETVAPLFSSVVRCSKNVLLGAACGFAALHLVDAVALRLRALTSNPLGYPVDRYYNAKEEPAFQEETTQPGARTAVMMRRPFAIVTGGRGAVGSKLVAQLLNLGYCVESWDRFADHASEINIKTIKEASSNMEAQLFVSRRVDLSSYTNTEAACFDFLKRNRNDGPDLLILNAGVVARTPIGSFTREQLQGGFNVNVVTGALLVLNELLLPMVRAEYRDGMDVSAPASNLDSPLPPWRRAVVFVSSVTAFSGSAFAAEYCSSKAALTVAADAIRAELEIRFSCSNSSRRAPNKNHFVPVDVSTVHPYIIGGASKMFDFALKRAPWLLPPLEPEAVATAICDAVRQRRSVVTMPWQFRIEPALKWTLPDFAWRLAEWFFGSNYWCAPEQWLEKNGQ